MTTKQYNEQKDLIKSLRRTNSTITVRFYFKYSHGVEYELYGVYHTKGDYYNWELYKMKNGITERIPYADYNINIPLQILKLMAKFESDTLRTWEK